MTRPTLIDLNPNEYNQGMRYYPFTINVNRCNGSCNTFGDSSDRIYVLNKTKQNMLT